MSNLNLAQAQDLTSLLQQRKSEAGAEVQEDIALEDKAKQVPIPSGYRILCAVPTVDKVTESGIALSDDYIKREELLATVLFVVEVGPDAYKDERKFPTGPWCKKGDFVIVRPNAGSRLVIHGKDFRMINDDSVEAVVEDPRGIKRSS
jgi:co-chaperonin GroES (HSP10)